MLNFNITKRLKKNEAGFTFVELMIASAMSIIVLGLLAHVFRAQQKEFGANTELNTMQANARGATEFISRSVQNAGFNVERGTCFLSATDHSLTAVYDEDNDGVIQNDEVITYYLANAWNNSATESNNFTAWFDVDNDGTIESNESRAMTVGMTVTGPPFNLYKVTPNSAGTGVVRSLVARNIDNMVIKYYDKNGVVLPVSTDTDNDGTGDVDYNINNDDQPDNGLWTFSMPIGELNDIRKVEVELIGRSRNKNPKEKISAGNYLPGSLAAVTTGNVGYSDLYYREDFTARMAPRNLTLAPWGSVSMVTTQAVVGCPDEDTFVQATLLDANGDPIDNSTIEFTSSGGTAITLDPPTINSSADGEGSTKVSFDFSIPYFTATVSAHSLVDDGSGEDKPIYNATPVSFTYGTQGGFVDTFNGNQTDPWLDLDANPLQFEIPMGQEYFISKGLLGVFTQVAATNGCNKWKDYIVQANLKQTLGTTWEFGHYMGLILRHRDKDNYIRVDLQDIKNDTDDPTNTERVLKITKLNAGVFSQIGVDTVMATIPEYRNSPDPDTPFTIDMPYTLKVQVMGDDIRVKLWRPLDPTDPNASEPVDWVIGGPATPLTDAALAVGGALEEGNIGVRTTDQVFQFDDIAVTNPPATL